MVCWLIYLDAAKLRCDIKHCLHQYVCAIFHSYVRMLALVYSCCRFKHISRLTLLCSLFCLACEYMCAVLSKKHQLYQFAMLPNKNTLPCIGAASTEPRTTYSNWLSCKRIRKEVSLPGGVLALPLFVPGHAHLRSRHDIMY